MPTWQFIIRGKQRKVVDRGLLVQALLELGRQLEREAQDDKASETEKKRSVANGEESPS